MLQSIINKDHLYNDQLIQSIEQRNRLTNWNLFSLLYSYKKKTLIKDSSRLQCLAYLQHVQFLDHQIECAKTVIKDMNGRALLADEVGLGKTIEAGLILKEYLIRGLVEKVLILVPASLVDQWVEELRTKFFIPVTAYQKNYRWDHFPIVVASLDLAKRLPHRNFIKKINYDLVIVDEAHQLKNNQTLNHTFVRSIKKKYCLLLTATPIQNNLHELFHLVSIIKPGLLQDYAAYKETYIDCEKNQREKLHYLIKKVMVRNRREDTILKDIKRNIHTVWLRFTEEEQAFYHLLQEESSTFSTFTKINYLKQFCSSREACYTSLQRNKNVENTSVNTLLMKEIEQLPHHAKAKKLLQIIKKLQGEKVIIFTKYRATQYYLQWFLQQHNILSLSFHGQMSRSKKQWKLQLFRTKAQVLIATEAGGEGINLQFCQFIINYDLPWNPMRLEQRIGRIHRYGQKNHIHIYNFAIKDTIEAQIMELLYNKLQIFERVVGRLDAILETLNIHNVDEEITTIMKQAHSIGELNVKLTNLFQVMEHFAFNGDSNE